MQALRAVEARATIVVVFERLDRARLAALACARALSSDVRAVHIDTERIESLRIRERWRRRSDGIALDIVASGDARALTLAYVRELSVTTDGPLLVIVPAVVPKLRLL